MKKHLMVLQKLKLKNRIKNCDKKYSCLDWYLCFVPETNQAIQHYDYLNHINSKNKSYSNNKKYSSQNTRKHRSSAHCNPPDHFAWGLPRDSPDPCCRKEVPHPAGMPEYGHCKSVW